MHLLVDAASNRIIREATPEEVAASEESDKSGNAGIFPCDWRSEGGWMGEDWRDCYTFNTDNVSTILSSAWEVEE